MKIKSNTLNIAKESDDFRTLEEFVRKIASENKIDNVESVQINLSKDQGIVGFKIAQGIKPEEQIEVSPQQKQPQTVLEQEPQTLPVEETEYTEQQTQPVEETPVQEEIPTTEESIGEDTKEEKEDILEGTGEPVSEEEAKSALGDMQKQFEESLKEQEASDASWLKEFDDLVTQKVQQKQQGA